MSDPQPDHESKPEPDGEGTADNSGGVEANEVNPDVPWIEPSAD